MNKKSTPVARFYGLCSSTDHHTDLCHSLQQSGVNEQPEAYVANIYNRPPQQQNQQQQNNYDLSSNGYNPVRQMTIQNMQFQSLTNQIGQMATQMNQAQSQISDKLPSQTVQNSKNVSAITLRSGNQIQVPPLVAAPAPEPVKLHSTPEKKDEIVAQK
ncbi:hypothetical protein GmHk_09G025804 [Glycine max]|nr:hypothetical protein GmHk_09G025804 [Glycine max]